MTACTQPDCAGTIVDGYCNVCGSPAGAPPFVPAGTAASVASPAPAAEPGLTAFRRGSGIPSRLRNAGLMTACTQPECTGTIVDGYCNVCGSPAGAPPFVPAGAAASAASPAPAAEPGPTAVRRGVVAATQAEKADAASVEPAAADTEQANTASAGPDDDDTVEMPRVVAVGSGDRHPPPQLPKQQEKVDPAAAGTEQIDGEQADLAAVDTEKVDPAKELAEDEPDGAKDYRTRVEEAQLPDEVRKAALCEVGKLERTSAQSPESGDIRTWLDTILDLPWSTKTTDWIDIEGSREVEATLRRLIGPAVADVEVADTTEVGPAVADVEVPDTTEVEPAVADLEEGDTAPAGPKHDDTVEMSGVPSVFSGGRQVRPQLPEQPVLGPEPVQTPAEKRRVGSLALAATALAALLIGALLFAASRDGGVTARSVPTVTATATATATKPTSEPSNESTGTGGEGPTIQLEDLPDSARPFETVRIQGTYRGGADTFLRVQRWEGGEWLAFPVPTKTDQSGQFTAYVEFGQPGRYRLRVLDPDSGATSKTSVLMIAG